MNTIVNFINDFIESCSSEYLDRVGSQEGLSRNRTRSFKINKTTNMVGMKNMTGRALTGKYLKNSSIQLEDNLWITLLEDVDLSTLIVDGSMLCSLSPIQTKPSPISSINILRKSPKDLLSDD